MVHYLGEMGYRVGISGKLHIWPESVSPFEYLNRNENPEKYVRDPNLEAVEKFLARELHQPSAAFICYY
ncbi:MAG: hypothetical protein CMI18_11790 [Opitutaceae bacterium]|nr:hypothetical protein [Opitutaceae bacterium]